MKGGTWTLEGVLAGLEEEVESLELEEERLRSRAGLTLRHRSLTDYLEQRGDPEEAELDRTKTRADFRELSDALLRADAERFPRGKPRVILLVDDLDRCEPARIAELLEATQLLLDTPLFLEVLALDVATVSRALLQVLPQSSGRDGKAALSYLEKVIQIPYRLRPMRAERLQDLLASPTQTLPAWERFLERVSGGAPASVGLPSEGPEVAAMRLACARIGSGPRETKRLMNLYGLLSGIWMRRDGKLPSFEVRQAAILFLALGTRYAAEICALIDELAERFERENLGVNWKLQSAVVRMCRRRAGQVEVPESWEKVARHLRDKDLLSPDLTLNAFGIQTTDLLRAFGFLDAMTVSSGARPEGEEAGDLEAAAEE